MYWNRDISTTLSGSGSFLLFPCKVKFQENGSKSDPEPEPGSESTEAFLLGRSKQGFSLNGDDSLWSGKDLWRIDLAKNKAGYTAIQSRTVGQEQ